MCMYIYIYTHTRLSLSIYIYICVYVYTYYIYTHISYDIYIYAGSADLLARELPGVGAEERDVGHGDVQRGHPLVALPRAMGCVRALRT